MHVVMRDICKSFETVKVLDHAQLEIKENQVHAFVGENGAGKSTMMKILTGVYGKDSGEIIINGEVREFHKIRESENLKIAFIQQELNVLPLMSIVDNMFLGREIKKRFGLLDKKRMCKKASETLHLLNLDIDPNTLLKDISVGMRQLVEIAKALLMEAELIIMDEPTAALTDREIESLFGIIRDLKGKGVSFIYISHRIEEIFKICDQVTVLRDGKYINSLETGKTNLDQIVSMMVGYDISDRYPRVDTEPGEVVLSVRNISRAHEFENISFDVRKGEIFGFAGLMGSGRTEIMHAVFGSTRIQSGEIWIGGKKAHINSPIDAKRLGIGFITEDRKCEGLILDFDVKNNFILPSLKDYIRKVFLNKKLIAGRVGDYVKKLSIKAASQESSVNKLSGGNQQKLVIARWLATNPKILIMDEPTRGVDVGAKKEIYEIINSLKLQGVAVIVVSSELTEIIGICDRIAVMHEGRMKGLLPIGEASQEKIMKYATGGGSV
jgi:ribose transport system ATP-binding protein